MFLKDKHGVYLCSEFLSAGWLVHGFGTRRSTPGSGGFRQASLRQIHSNKALIVSGCTGLAGEGDALITTAPGQLLSIRTADCLPVLMFEQKRRVVAAVHAGWRGTAGGIAVTTAIRLQTGFQADLENLMVAIGPGIGPCCYEVGPEVIKQFRGQLPGLPHDGCKGMLDLAAVNRLQLIAAGVPAANIYMGAPCTSCHPEEFYSYRREPGETGRMISVIGIRP